MPPTDKQDPENMPEHDKEGDNDRGGMLKAKSASSKSKDLSHVPCKFFKVGACTAGSSCPFSHTVQEPGHQKDVCAWFVKGNCKFGHKCALAHILPGQGMSMDRKNKKAAQLAANGGIAGGGNGGGGRESRSSRGGKKDTHQAAHSHGGSSVGTSVNTRTGLLSGSTAPTRTTSTRPPISMPLKAQISPSAPAPPLNDTDFAAFVLPDDIDNHKLNTPTGPGPNTETSAGTKQETGLESREEAKDAPPSEPSAGSPSPVKFRNPSPPTLPLKVPSAPRRPVLPADAADLGPIGSPPRGSLSTNSPISASTPPQGAGIPSTFHAQTSLLTESRNRLGGGTGVASSLGHTHPQAWNTDIGPVPSQVLTSSTSPSVGVSITGVDRDRDGLIIDEDLEEFLPSSLTDLLTPSERSRRMSRTHSGSSRPVNLNDAPSPHPTLHPQLTQTQGHHGHHRYSRSVPAPSLLGDVKSIWAERGNTNNAVPGSPDTHTFGLGAIGSGTPSSLKSSNGFGGLGFNLGNTTTASGTGTTPFRDDAHSPSSALLAPSNASAAFLPTFHHYYSKMNAGSNGRGPSTNAGLGLGAGLGGLSGLSRSPLSHAPLHGPAADEGRTGPAGGVGMGPGDTSPSIRALQAHAPGQSLPQGLAAGYSRIHALPATGSPGSIGTSGVGGGAFSPGHGPVPFGINAGSGLGQDWHLQQNHSHLPTEAISHLSLSSHHDMYPSTHPPTTSAPLSSSMVALESMFSRLPPTSSPLRTPPHSSANGSRNWHTQNALSPLSRPIVTADDDDLFSMDG
ncbi:hypothetical protein BDN67DRAFT_81495 [Paxillus ammoniavirescens]|nr:hypothetical protein BDN67DRAFT_81495 [Paxillus ammoniavirescens]